MEIIMNDEADKVIKERFDSLKYIYIYIYISKQFRIN